MILAIVLLLIITVLYFPIRLKVSYIKKNLDVSLNFGFLKIRIPVKKKKNKENDGKKEDNENKKKDAFGAFNRFFCVLQGFYDASPAIKKTICVEKLELKSVFGTDDAAFTGTAVGLAYAEVYKLIGFLSVIFKVNMPKIEITPVFEDRMVFDIECKSIIKTKLAHIIIAGYKFYTSYKNALKGKD